MAETRRKWEELTREEKEFFMTPSSHVHEAAFAKMCAVLELDQEERRLARLAISNYEVQKERIGKDGN